MSSKENEYKEMFLAEAQENYEELNNLFTKLEKDVENKKAVDAIFRITHTLKGNAMGMGFEDIAELGHVMEDVFSHVKNGVITLDSELFETLFKANDKLGALIEALKTDKKVSYKGVKAKLQVYVKNLMEIEKEKETQKEVSTENESSQTDSQVAEENKQEETESASEEDIRLDKKEQNQTEESLVDMEDSGASEVIDEGEGNEEEEMDENQPKIGFSDLVQIPVRKLDSLLNLVGELIIERDSLISQSIDTGRGVNDYARLQRITSDLQYGVMDVRLVQVGFLFNKFNRIIRDVANIEKKKVDLKLEGTENEIDRNVLKIMSDSLVHLVRNAVSHGIESPEERLKKGKPERGVVTLRASNEKDTVIIEVLDDGNGIDPEAIRKKAVEKGIVDKAHAQKVSDKDAMMFIFEPGFSNAEKITEVSGRGVGMDVVKRATESIGGKIDVSSEIGKGSTISLSLPSSMAVKGALLFETARQEFAVPLTYTDGVVSIQPNEIHKVGNGLVAKYLDHTISIVFLKDLLEADSIDAIASENVMHRTFDQVKASEKLDVLVVSYRSMYVGLVVDKLIQQKEIVEKTLLSPLDNIDLVSGATILGNGNVCLVIDVTRIINLLFKIKNTQITN